MKALKIDKTGSLADLKVVTVENPFPQKGEVIIQVRAAAINPSDPKSVLGKMKEMKPPRIPGRDFAGIVVSDSKWKGKSVFGTGGELGLSKDGSHAEFVAVPEVGVVEMPKGISFVSATAMGLSYFTAWQTLVVAGQLKSQDTVLVTGATGAVGGAAVRIAKSKGARVLGTVVKSNDVLPADIADQIEWIFLDKEQLVAGVNRLTQNRGVDLILDVVGGLLFEPCIQCLGQGGRQIAIANAGDPRVSFNLIDFYHKQAHLIGVDTLKISIEDSANILKALAPGMEKGLYIPQKIEEISLQNAPQAYVDINNGKAKAKKVIVFE